MANVGTNTQGKVLTARGVTSNSGFLDIGSLSGLTQYGVVVSQGLGAFQSTSAGTTGQVLTAVTGGNPVWSTPTSSVTSVSGTAGRITSTGGTTPVINIDPNFVGQTTITTLGTITSGTWSATNIALSKGGTNASLTASNGGIFYSTASAGAILSGTATAGQVLQSGASSAPSWSTATFPSTATSTGVILRADGTNWSATSATYPNTVAQGDIVYGSASNTISSLAKDTNATRYLSNTGTSNNPAWAQVALGTGVSGQLPLANGGTNANLTASNGGIFYSTASAGAILSGTATAGQILQSGASTTPAWSTATYPSTAGTSGNLLQSDGTNWGSVAVATAIQVGSTWTPAINFGGGSTGITYSSRAATYYTIGNVVWILVNITLSNKGSSTGNVTITGLPFTAAFNNDMLCWTSGSTTWPASCTALFAEAGGTTLTIYGYASNVGPQNLTNTNFSNTSSINVSGFYFK